MLPCATQLFAFSLSPTQDSFTTVTHNSIIATESYSHISKGFNEMATHAAQRNSMHLTQLNASRTTYASESF